MRLVEPTGKYTDPGNTYIMFLILCFNNELHTFVLSVLVRVCELLPTPS